MSCVNCRHSGTDHSFKEPTVCIHIDCNCIEFVEATLDNEIKPTYYGYLASISTVKGKVRWILENVKFTRNLPNKNFVDFYREKVNYGTDPETIRRAKQLLVEEDPVIYGVTSLTLQEEKVLKQLAIEEFVTT